MQQTAPRRVRPRGFLASTELLAALAGPRSSDPAHAIAPNQTQVTLPDQLPWKPWNADGPRLDGERPVFGAMDNPGPYAILVRWHSDFMSAPHTLTDRLCFVISAGGWIRARISSRRYRAGARQRLRAPLGAHSAL